MRARHVLCCLFACWQINNTFHCIHNTIYSECFTGFRARERTRNRNSGIKYVKTVLSTLPVLVRFAMRTTNRSSSSKWRLLPRAVYSIRACTNFCRALVITSDTSRACFTWALTRRCFLFSLARGRFIAMHKQSIAIYDLFYHCWLADATDVLRIRSNCSVGHQPITVYRLTLLKSPN